MADSDGVNNGVNPAALEESDADDKRNSDEVATQEVAEGVEQDEEEAEVEAEAEVGAEVEAEAEVPVEKDVFEEGAVEALEDEEDKEEETVSDIEANEEPEVYRHRIGSFDSEVELEELWDPAERKMYHTHRYCGGCIQCSDIPSGYAEHRQCFCWRWFTSTLLDRLYGRVWVSYCFMQNLFLGILFLARVCVHAVYVHGLSHRPEHELGPAGFFLGLCAVVLSPHLLAPCYKMCFDAIGIYGKKNFHMRNGVFWLGYNGPPGGEPFFKRFHAKIFYPPIKYLLGEVCPCGFFHNIRDWASHRYAMDDLCVFFFFVFPLIAFCTTQFHRVAYFILASTASALLFTIGCCMFRALTRVSAGCKLLKDLVTRKQTLENRTCCRIFQCLLVAMWLCLVFTGFVFLALSAFIHSGAMQGFLVLLISAMAIPVVLEEWVDYLLVRPNRFTRARQAAGRCFCLWDQFYSRQCWYYCQTLPFIVIMSLLILPTSIENGPSRQFSGGDAIDEYGYSSLNISDKSASQRGPRWAERNNSRHPRYPVCGMRWGTNRDLTILDVAILAEDAYCTKEGSQNLIDMQFGEGQWKLMGGSGASEQQVVMRDFYHAEWDMTVIALRGTYSPYEWAIDIEMFVDSGLIKVFPPMLLFPDYVLRTIVYANCIVDWLFYPKTALQHTLWKAADEYVNTIKKTRGYIMMVGHSMGGSVAQILALRHGLPAVTIAAPGIGYGLDRFQVPNPDLEIHERVGLNVHAIDDVVSYVGLHMGFRQRIDCPSCHQIVSLRCALQRSCGDYYRDRPFLQAQCDDGEMGAC